MKFIIISVIIFLSANINLPQTLKYEMRGTWIATVKNIDFPSSNNLTTSQQITELVEIFDNLKSAGINSVFFQVRSECDAFYDSRYDPWSYWLTGEQGKAPDPYYDPLEFAINEAHKRGIELHAWINPFRSIRDKEEYMPAKFHVSNQHPDWILDFGKYKMLDPGIPAVREYIVKIVKDIISRYNVDGIHFDDYFYPYSPKITNEDYYSFKKYGGNFSNIDNWRRNNINILIKSVYEEINKVDRRLKFGVSPFGIVDNKYAGTRGMNSISTIFSDPLNWINNKYVDYIIPQIYWEIGKREADYSKLLKWWSSIINDRHLYIGQYSSKMMADDYDGVLTEIGNQIRLNRRTDKIKGSSFFSAKSIFLNYSGFKDTLKYNYYNNPALIPSMKWKDSIPPLKPEQPSIKKIENGYEINWKKPDKAVDGDVAKYYVIYKFLEGEPINLNKPDKILFITPDSRNFFIDYTINKLNINYTYVITSVDDGNNESEDYAKIVLKRR